MLEQNKDSKKRLLVFASYGMEMVECGGTLMKHVDEGWDVHVAVALCRKENKHFVKDAAKHMGVTIEFLDLDVEDVAIGKKERQKMVRSVRRFKPSSVIFYDPEHSLTDMDPGRRSLSYQFLETLSQCGRNMFPDLGEPFNVGSIYYMSPLRPNCAVDISSTFRRKKEALAMLRFQMEGTGKEVLSKYGQNLFELLGGKDPGTDYGRGLFVLSEMEKGHSLHYGLGEHGTPALVEVFRKEGLIVLNDLK